MKKFRKNQEVIINGRNAKIVTAPAQWFRGPRNYTVIFEDGQRAILEDDGTIQAAQ